jgi:hypothetical protein
MNGWMKLLGLIALVALLIPTMWELKLIDMTSKKIKKMGKGKPQ